MTLPDFSFERKLYKKGYRIIAGVDEVGRGCFAGPVVAAAVAFAPNSNFQIPISNQFSKKIIINDSKKLSPKQREIADKWIRKNALAWGVGSANVGQINRLGIKKASEIAFRKAIKTCGVEINYLLIDAFFIPYVRGLRRKNQKPIIKGDTKSVSIAAASIIAKVYRDKLMTDLGKKPKYRKYKWVRNKGYGTLEHRKAIKKYGLTRQHRKQFVETWINNSSSSRVR
ncbi:MAG TPA: ribonuclease HII [Candidatus Saccharimonadales bacterium]|jgi:ribonuclease HII|nr:ribonuclease HII [Candidatus Saccharimonadales bacterium]